MSTLETHLRVKGLLVPAVCIVTLLIPMLVWLVSTGSPFAYFTHQVPPGQTFYVMSKLCGLLALALFWLQCMTALGRFSPVLRGFLQLSRSQHVLLGSTTSVLIMAHLALFITASSLRTGHIALALLVPKFDQGFYTSHISYGALAFWVLVLVIVAGVLRIRGRSEWRWMHRTVLLVFALALLHGMSIGSETRFGLMKYVYAFMGLSVATAVCSWLWPMLKHRLRGRQHDGGVLTGAAQTVERANK